MNNPEEVKERQLSPVNNQIIDNTMIFPSFTDDPNIKLEEVIDLNETYIDQEITEILAEDTK